MHHHSGRLVHDQQVLVLIDYIERNVLGQNFQSPPLIRHHKLYDIPGTHDAVGLRHPVIHPDVFLLDCQLDTMPGSVFHMRSEVFVHPHRSLAVGHVETVMLEHSVLTGIRILHLLGRGLVHIFPVAEFVVVQIHSASSTGFLAMSVVRYSFTSSPIRQGSSEGSGTTLHTNALMLSSDVLTSFS